MGKIVAVANQKGGTGKTSTCTNLGAALALDGQSILLVDVDAQANATSGLGVAIPEGNRGIYGVLLGKADARGAILPTSIDWLEIIPSTVDLVGAEVELVNAFSRELRLAKALKSVRNLYDFILLDCPPSLGLLTVNALSAADSILIPVQCEYYALEGLGQLLKTIDMIKDSVNPALEIEGVLLTMHDARINLSSQVIGEVRKFFSDNVYDTVIPRNVRISEAPGFGKPVVTYDTSSRGARAYMALALEFLHYNNVQSKAVSRK
jgi:chromosome partitioning protein